MHRKIYLLIVGLTWLVGLAAQSPVWVQKAHPDGLQVNGAIFSGDGQSVLTGTNCHPAKIRRFNTTDGALTWDYTVSLSLNCMMGVALSSNNQYFASAEENGHLLLFDYTQASPTLAQTISLGTSYTFSVDFAPNSSRVVVGCSNGKLKAYNLPGGTEAWSITAHPTWVTAVDYSSDNALIATGGSDNKIKIWNAAGTPVRTLSGHTDDITSVKFTPDNQKLVTCSRDKKMKVWEVATGTLLQTIAVSNQIVNALDVSPDGHYAVTAASDSLLNVWNLTNYALAGSFATGDLDVPMTVSWSPVSNLIVCGTSNGSVALFDAAKTVSATDLPTISASIFPNPCADALYVEWPTNEAMSRAELYDLNGRLLLQHTNLTAQNHLSINLRTNHIPASALLLRLTTADGRTREQIIARH